MSSDRDTTRIVRSWLEEGATALPDRVLDAVLDQVPATPQRRAGWPAWRFPHMTNTLRIALAAAAVVVVAFLGFRFLVPNNTGGPGPTATATPTPAPAIQLPPSGTHVAGTYVMTPFIGEEQDPCPLQTPPCTDPAADDSIRLTLTVPDGWAVSFEAAIELAVEGFDPPDGATLLFTRGAALYSDPCQSAGAGDIPIGPTVDDFVSALADHPLLDTTTPVDVTLAGYSGKYLDLQVPSELPCPESYWPWDGGLRAQGPGHQWHLWILDVDGVRVVVESMEYAGTSTEHKAELQAIVDSIQIEP